MFRCVRQTRVVYHIEIQRSPRSCVTKLYELCIKKILRAPSYVENTAVFGTPGVENSDLVIHYNYITSVLMASDVNCATRGQKWGRARSWRVIKEGETSEL